MERAEQGRVSEQIGLDYIGVSGVESIGSERSEWIKEK